MEGNERILLVDDEEMVRTGLKIIFTHRGYQISEAANGKDAIQKFTEASPPISLVLLDLELPDMSGMKVLSKLREVDAQVKVILFSGNIADRDTSKAQELGAVDMIPKPFRNHNLLRLVRDTLDQSRSAPHLKTTV